MTRKRATNFFQRNLYSINGEKFITLFGRMGEKGEREKVNLSGTVAPEM